MQITNIRLYKNVPLDNKQNIQIDFPNGNETTQNNYFHTNFNMARFNDCSWAFPDSIRLEISYENALPCNYLSYINNDNKTIYCFVLDKKYINDNVTEFNIQVDYFQSYMFDHELMSSYIDRQHIDRAVIENNSVKRIFDKSVENIETGTAYVEDKNIVINKPDYNDLFVSPSLVVSKKPLFSDKNEGGGEYVGYTVEGYKTPYYVYVSFLNQDDYLDKTIRVQKMTWNTVADGNGKYIFEYDNLSKIVPAFRDVSTISNGDVVAHIPIKQLPFKMIKVDNQDYDYIIQNTSDIKVVAVKIQDKQLYVLQILIHNNQNKIGSINLDDFIPPFQRTNHLSPIIVENESKLFTDPYFKMNFMTNYENIKELEPFYFNGSVDLLYDFIVGIDFREIISFYGYRQPNSLYLDSSDKSLPISTDLYLQYMQNNKASRIAGVGVPIATTLLGATATAVGAGAVGVPLLLGGIASVGGTIANDIAKVSDLKSRADSINKSGESVLLDIRTNHFDFRVQTLKLYEPNLLRVYDYLRIYGYKSGRYTKPNLQSRYHFNYIKTIGANIKPIKNMSANAISELQNIYDKGVIIHHLRDKTNYVLDIYSEYENIEMGLLNE